MYFEFIIIVCIQGSTDILIGLKTKLEVDNEMKTEDPQRERGINTETKIEILSEQFIRIITMGAYSLVDTINNNNLIGL